MKARLSKTWLRVFGLVIGLGSFGLALSPIPLQELREVMLESADTHLLMCTAAWIVSIFFQTWRWQMMLQWQKPVAFHTTLRLFILNRITNLLFPFRAGEGVRVVAAKQQLNINAPYLVASVINERILNIVFLALIAFTLTFYLADLRKYQAALLVIILAATCVSVLFVWQRQKKLKNGKVNSVRSHEFRGHKSRLQSFWHKFVQGMSIFKSPSVLMGSLLTSLASWFCVWFGVFILSQNLNPTQPIICAMAVLLFMNVVSLVHLTPSNIGPFQWGCILAFSYFGVNQTEAVGFSLVLQAVRIGAAFLVGIYANLQSSLSFNFGRQRRLLEVSSENTG
ncbi:flippase-like domain-containing protein [candidate division KSB1 bacterium]|nr:flippase-like domain-containing protein [candidate division KSB1 bacterium]NIR69654.1 flippase-like domain-containing protein [candidate division KSB1 bacterium]NIS22883.1 flippase-like domain-containing protein [candidate division KSB1 bacterium]NIT69721.1 flippase-like domain-containing protein [candidate division KSB1 bacterium]NIU23389.1 flippase-like domain-containing protein [candidate division KSB1 bacterium]